MSGYFSELPDSVMLPFAYVEFDPSQADRGLATMPFNVLLVGQALPTGTADFYEPKRPTTAAQGNEFFGVGSQLAQMVEAYFKANSYTKMTAIGVPDYTGGVQASGLLSFTGSVSSAAPLCLYIGGQLVRIATADGDSAKTVAANVVTAVNNAPGLPVTAILGTGELANQVTLKAKHKGDTGNDIDVRFGYLEEPWPVGLGVSITAFAGGSGNPEPGEIIASLGGQRYHIIAWPWTDTASLNALKEELDARWGPLRQIDGQAITVKAGTFAEVTTFTSGRNDKHLTVFASEGSPTLPWVDAAACAAVIAYYGADDPARPFQTLPIPGVLAPAVKDRWSDFPEKNQALMEGCSARGVNESGQVVFLNEITTYRFSPSGAETKAYQALNSLLTVSFLRYDWNNTIKLKYGRYKLADNDQGKNYAPGQKVMTPSLGRAEAIASVHKWMRMGLVEAPEDFAERLVVERDANNPNRLNWMMSPDLVNQFRIAATAIAFLL
jgi:phage tail sheath gpL-like